MEKRLKFLKFFAKSVILDENFLIFLLCNALSNAYKNSDLFSFSKGFLGAFFNRVCGVLCHRPDPQKTLATLVRMAVYRKRYYF